MLKQFLFKNEPRLTDIMIYRAGPTEGARGACSTPVFGCEARNFP